MMRAFLVACLAVTATAQTPPKVRSLNGDVLVDVQPNKDLVINTQGGTPMRVGQEISTLQSRFDALVSTTNAMFDGAATARAALSDGVQSVATSLTTTVQTAGAATAAAIASLSSTLLQRDNCPIGQRWNYTANACTPQAVQLAAASGVACNANTAGMILMDNGQLVQCKPGQTAFSPVYSAGVGLDESMPGTSCADIMQRNVAVSSDNSGWFWLQYPGMSRAGQMYCDFTVSPPMDMGGDGSTSLLAARSCQYIADTANTTAASGSYWINTNLADTPPTANSPQRVTCPLAQLRIFAPAPAAPAGAVDTCGGGGSSSTAVNTYAYLLTNIAAGANSVTIGVRTPSGTYNTTGIGSAFAVGDLVLIHQTQNYATKNLNGVYEYLRVANVAGNRIFFTTGVSRLYYSDRPNPAIGTTTARVTQLVKVARDVNYVVPYGETVGAAPWDGFTGGIVAIFGRSVTVDGTIDASCTGFRGGLRNPRLGCGCQSDPSAGYPGESWNGRANRDGQSGGFGCCSGAVGAVPAGYRGRGLNNQGGGGGGSGACHGGGGAGGGYGDWTNALKCPSGCGHRGLPGDGAPECTRAGSWSRHGEGWRSAGNPTSFGRVVANEGGQFLCNPNEYVIYGAQNGWTYPQRITTRVVCNNGVFGGDPVPGVAKQCRCGVIDDDPNMTNLMLGSGGGGGNGYSPLCSGAIENNDGGPGGGAVIIKAGSGGVTVGCRGQVMSNGCQGYPQAGTSEYNWWIASNSQDGSGGGGSGGSVMFDSAGPVSYGTNKVAVDGGDCGADNGWGPRPAQRGGHGSYGRVHVRAPAATGTIVYAPAVTTSTP